MLDVLIIPIVAIGAPAVVFVIWILAHYWWSVRQADIDAGLKQEMLNRGLSADEIERVLRASSHATASPPAEPAPAAETISDKEYALVEKMLDDGHSLEEIERIIRALRGDGKPVRFKVPGSDKLLAP